MRHTWSTAAAALVSITAASAAEPVLHPLGAVMDAWQAPIARAPSARAAVAAAGEGLAPRRVDLTPLCPPVGDQGTLGSCVSWAVGYTVKSYLERVEHGWAYDSTTLYSPHFLYTQVNGGRDGGSTLYAPLGILSMRGVVSLAQDPYTGDFTTWPDATLCRAALDLRDAQTIGVIAVSDLATMKARLATGCPLVVGLVVDGAWDGLSAGTGYVWYPSQQAIRGGHAVAIIGYDDDVTDGNGHVGAFRIQNQWGTGWGDAGRAWIAYDAFSTPSVWQVGYAVDRTGYRSTLQAHLAVPTGERGRLNIAIGVGDTAAPTWSYGYYYENGDTTIGMETVLDLTDAAAYWPPSPSRPWWLKIDSQSTDGAYGAVTSLTLTDGVTTYLPSMPLPVDVPHFPSAQFVVVDGATSGGDGTGLTGQYWSDHLASFDGPATVTRVDPTVDFDWGDGSPARGVTSDWFSARWSGQVEPPTGGAWTFTVTGDDGVRLWIDGALVVDAWYDEAPNDHSATVQLAAGVKHDLRLDYYENRGGAVARLWWRSATMADRAIVPRSALYPATVSGGGTGLTAQYWSNQLATFDGAPTVARIDPTVDFDWGTGAPADGVSVDDFTARWSGQVVAPTTDDYTFTVTGDDGVRLWIAGVPLIDAWYDQGATSYSATVHLVAGERVDLRLDFYEHCGLAVARLHWSTPTMADQVVPAAVLYPTATAAGAAAPTGDG